MANKYYVVWKGEKTGVFEKWDQVKSYTQGRADAQFMGFMSKAEADNAYSGTYTKALTQRALKTPKSKAAKPSTNSQNSPVSSSTTTFDYQIYSDGACSPNPGASGTGMVIYKETNAIEYWYGLHEANGTNNTAELNGLLTAFRYAKSLLSKKELKIEILSDSKYSIDCITKWAKGWKQKGWTRGKGEEIKNLAIIQQCYELYNEIAGSIKISHVKGHANIEGNELADRMAVYARLQKEKTFKRFQVTTNILDILAMKSG